MPLTRTYAGPSAAASFRNLGLDRSADGLSSNAEEPTPPIWNAAGPPEAAPSPRARHRLPPPPGHGRASRNCRRSPRPSPRCRTGSARRSPPPAGIRSRPRPWRATVNPGNTPAAQAGAAGRPRARPGAEVHEPSVPTLVTATPATPGQPTAIGHRHQRCGLPARRRSPPGDSRPPGTAASSMNTGRTTAIPATAPAMPASARMTAMVQAHLRKRAGPAPAYDPDCGSCAAPPATTARAAPTDRPRRSTAATHPSSRPTVIYTRPARRHHGDHFVRTS